MAIKKNNRSTLIQLKRSPFYGKTSNLSRHFDFECVMQLKYAEKEDRLKKKHRQKQFKRKKKVRTEKETSNAGESKKPSHIKSKQEKATKSKRKLRVI